MPSTASRARLTERTGRHPPDAVLFVPRRASECGNEHLSHGRSDVLQARQLIPIEFNEFSGQGKPFAGGLLAGKLLNEHGTTFVAVLPLSDLVKRRPAQEHDRDDEKQDGNDLVNDKVLRVEVQMVPNPDSADDDGEQGQDCCGSGLSPLTPALSHREREVQCGRRRRHAVGHEVP